MQLSGDLRPQNPYKAQVDESEVSIGKDSNMKVKDYWSSPSFKIFAGGATCFIIMSIAALILDRYNVIARNVCLGIGAAVYLLCFSLSIYSIFKEKVNPSQMTTFPELFPKP
jgi:hypothetical protein